METDAREYVRITGRYQIGELVSLRDDILDPSRGLDPVMEVIYGPLTDISAIRIMYEILYKRNDITDTQLRKGFPWYVCRRVSVRPLEEYFLELTRLGEVTDGFSNKQFDYTISKMHIMHGVFSFKQLRLAKDIERKQYRDKSKVLEEDVKRLLSQEESDAGT